MSRFGGYKVTPVALVMGLGPVCALSVQAEQQQVMEEVVVQGRLQSGAEQLVNERMNDEVVTDFIGAEMISRIGDSTVASALRRVSGLTLVNDKFVYVRGLGERYSSSTLNGATIPSPDLTRNVIPLDIFPTSIVEALSVQKSYSADRPASFGGGNIDIRTKGIPDSLTYEFEISGNDNSETSGGVLTYAGGGKDRWGTDDGTRALSTDITDAIKRFSGRIDAQSILNGLRREGDSTATLADAQLVSRNLALQLNRNISINSKSTPVNYGLKGSVGDNYYLDDNWEIGFLAAGSYSNQWRKTGTIARNFAYPDERFEREKLSTHSVDLNGNLNLGVRFTEDHKISTTSLYLRNTDDKTSLVDYFNENRERSSGIGFQRDKLRFEERSLVVNQIKGEHIIGRSTRELLPWLPLNWLSDQFKVDWYYSKSKADTDIPNEATVTLATTNDPTTGDVLTSTLQNSNSAADYRFTTLNDKVEDYAGQFTWPFEFGNSTLEISGGAEHSQKVRVYRQSQFGLGPLNTSGGGLSGSLGEMLSDTNVLDPSYNFVFNLSGSNNQSYLAATTVDGAFGKLDWNWNETWRLSAGLRRESYRQAALDWNIYGYSKANPQVSNDPDVLANSVYSQDKTYPSVSLTYMGDLWAETFQLRFGWSKTVVRPDLREITDASYYDARTGFLTNGNSSVRPAELTNYDVRGEWFFEDGANLTVTAFYKDIANPIEFFEAAASDTNRAREIVNAESGNVGGVEIEVLKNLGFIGDYWENFFVQGNTTIQSSNLVAGSQADAPTNNERKLAGASDYVVNLLVGFDSPDGRHAATVIYNVFGERLYEAGRLGSPDAFEQPFNSLDMTYSWYPTDLMTLSAKVQNILNDEVTIERGGVEVFTQKPGTSFSLSFKYSL